MKKRNWLKRVLLFFVLVFILIIGGTITLAYMSGRTPSWYRSGALSPEALKKNYDSAAVKLNNMMNWAQDQSNWPQQSGRPRVDTDPTTAPAASQTISLTQDELNAILSIHRGPLLERYGHVIADPYIAVHEGHLVLAVTHKGSGRVISMHVEPKLNDEGMFILSPDTLMAGSIPVPRGLWTGYTERLTEILSVKLEHAREQALLEADGTGNEAAIISAMSRLVLNSVAGKASDPVLFIASNPEQFKTGFPVKITNVKVDDGSLSLTVIPLNPQEQQQLLARLRAPAGEEPAPAITAGPRTAMVD